MITEIWKQIEDYPNYEFSNYGHVRNIVTKQVLKGVPDKDGYYRVDIRDKNNKRHGMRVNRLIAIAFLGYQEGLVVNHKDGNKQNNRICNLEWITAEENSTLAAKDNLYKTQPILINETGEMFNSIRECAKSIGCDSADISHYFKNGKKVSNLSFTKMDEIKTEKEFLYPYQRDAVERMHNGCILNGGTGSGKSRTGLYYYFKKNGGSITKDEYVKMTNTQPLFIITTAMKRDKLEWESELNAYNLSTNAELCNIPIVVDSWNNIKKYKDVENAFFIFDEDKVCGTGSWAKTFLKITKKNEWIILSASPGDRWIDYMFVFIANGFYKNQTEFRNEHVEYDRFKNFPSIKAYHNTGRLLRLRKKTLVEMDTRSKVNLHHIDVYCDYDKIAYKKIFKERWNFEKNKPIENASELCYQARKIVNDDESRLVELLKIIRDNPRVIIFYNFDYELESIKNCFDIRNILYREWNGHKHEEIPTTVEWVYLVQYNSGAEGWNCTETDTLVYYSQNYSYKMMLQAAGRINRANTPFMDLYYYHLKSRSPIDNSISKALSKKKKFNETKFVDSLDDI